MLSMGNFMTRWFLELKNSLYIIYVTHILCRKSYHANSYRGS